jgi:hypothetical protein
MARLVVLTLALALLLPASARGDSGWTWPLRGEVITPYRNGDDPYAARQHRGIDIAAAVGDPVVAATDGTVTFAGVAGSSGLTVGIRTGDGRFDTSYLHLSTAAVRRGDSVHRGDRVGAVGMSGQRSAERPHVHFGVREAGSDHAYRDPLDFLPPLGAPPPQPEAPRGAPAPVGSPVRPAPTPVRVPRSWPAPLSRPVPARRPARRRRPAGSPRPLPDARLLTLPARRPVTASRPARGPAAQGRRAVSPLTSPILETAPALPAGDATAQLGSAPGAGDAAQPGESAAAPRPVAGSRGRGGIDLGWLAACVGLVVAAFALGHPERARAAAGRGRRTAAALLRPLTGRG